MSEKENKVFITPDDASWVLIDDERVMAERDTSEPPYTDGWFIISVDDQEMMRLHKDEIAALYEFAHGEDENVKKLVNAARRVEVLMDTLSLLGIGHWLSPRSQYYSDWAMFHIDLQEALLPFDEEAQNAS